MPQETMDSARGRAGAYTVRLAQPLNTKMHQFMDETGLPGAEILRLLVLRCEAIDVRFEREPALKAEAAQ
jgi:hypothetical protein